MPTLNSWQSFVSAYQVVGLQAWTLLPDFYLVFSFEFHSKYVLYQSYEVSHSVSDYMVVHCGGTYIVCAGDRREALAYAS